MFEFIKRDTLADPLFERNTPFALEVNRYGIAPKHALPYILPLEKRRQQPEPHQSQIGIVKQSGQTLSARVLTLTKAAFMERTQGLGLAYIELCDSFDLALSARFGVIRESGQVFSVKTACAAASLGHDFLPTEEEYAQIRRDHALGNIPREKFKVYSAIVAGTDVDAHYERFTKNALADMAKSVKGGAPLLKDHDKLRSDGVIGRVFAAFVKTINGKPYLIEKVYIHNNNTQEKQAVIDGIESGENKALSVGARVNRADYVCDECQRPVFLSAFDSNAYKGSWCGHMPGMEIENGKAATASILSAKQKELSRVTIGAQEPASFIAP